MLILAGVTIAALSGDNGILKRASEAKEQTQIQSEEELRRLTQMEAATNLENTTHIDGSTGEPKTVTIPAGFAVSQIEGENTIADGLVIIDKNGNEFVWVSVPKTNEVYQLTDVKVENFTNEVYINIEKDLHNYTMTYRLDSDGVETANADIYYDGCGIESKEKYNELKQRMLKSLYEKEGFWIGRYETGMENENPYYGNEYSIEHPIEEKPVIKANVYPYTWVRCYQAQSLAENMAPVGYTSSLMFGVQWDLVAKSLEYNYPNLNETSYDDGNLRSNLYNITNLKAKYSNNWGKDWFNCPYNKTTISNILLTTGASEEFKKNNIYDLIGNVTELSLEKNSNGTIPVVFRDGTLNNDAGYNHRGQYTVTSSSDSLGFRVCMYQNI